MISFIIPAHNEEALIGQTLSAIHASARALNLDYEIIVANDSSTDRTAAIAIEHGVRVVDVARRQIAATRNAGAKAAIGEILFFIDADTFVNPRTIRSALRALSAGMAGGGCCINFDGKLPPYGVVMKRMFQMWAPAIGLAGGCFLFCTRKTYLAAGGFDERFYASEEIGFSRRLKRVGRFIVLRDRVTTSGRKIRSYTGMQMLAIFLRLARGGEKALQRREGLEIWYGPRNAAH